ncbi:MAG: GNAT family N-acetyltransferase [Myxococcota bacterium]
MRPDDAERIAEFHRALSLETVHFRYFSGLARLPPPLLARFTHVDFARDMGLVAELHGRVIGLASYHRDGTSDTAEVAFVIADAQQGRGLGTLLLEVLAELARERGVTRFRADTLLANRAMLRVFADAGFEIEREPDREVVHVRFPLAVTARARAASERREHLAEARSIAHLLAPRSIALLGESSALAARVFELGFRGSLCDQLRALPTGVDLALFSGDSARAPAIVAACADAGAHALVLGPLAGAPPSAELAAFDRELRIAARRNGMRLLGPDSLGVVNTAPDVALCAAVVSPGPAAGGLALACDSSGAGAALLQQALAEGVGISSFASLGRRADVSVNDLLQYWQDDAATRAVALGVADVGNPAKFARIAARVGERVPIHALAGDGGALGSLLAGCGVKLWRTPAELLAAARRE